MTLTNFTKTYANSRNLQFVLLSFIVLLFVLMLAHTVHGQVMQSSNYRLQSDSVNFGGARSTSSSYLIEDTAGEVGTGISSSTNYVVKAGYQQMQEINISITQAANVTMSPALGGVTGGTANGSTFFTVTTDNPAGYTAVIAASSSPALASALDSFADYAPAGAAPDFTFGITASASAFAFSPEGTDISQRFKDNGATCNAGSGDTTNACWDGLSTSQKTILTRTSPNHPNGTLATLKFRAASGASHVQTDGVYVATTTVTVLPL
jgi:hypothetical protein